MNNDNDKGLDGLLEEICAEKEKADIDRLADLLEGVKEILILVFKSQTDDLAEQIKNVEKMRIEAIDHVFSVLKELLNEKRKNKEA